MSQILMHPATGGNSRYTSENGVVVATSPGDETTAEALHALSNLSSWAELAQGAFAKNTQRAWRADWRVFLRYCVSANVSPLPAAATTVRHFLQALHPLEDSPTGLAPP